MIDGDFPDSRELIHSELTYRGKVWEIAKDEFYLGDQSLVRDYLRHPGAVAIVGINSDDEVLLISQYRHPVGQTMVEIPAGLLDNSNEDPAVAAARELLEETGYEASTWSVLLDMCTSPGSSSEAIRIYLAEDLTFQPDLNYVKAAEESEIEVWFEPLELLITKVLAGRIQSPTAVAGILALFVAKQSGTRRDLNDKWPIRDYLLQTNRVFKF
jgi:ADP-ribose pyrophosphatase